eukprot:1153109-Pelagomonas_calceolata.AAC.2
MHTHAQAQAGQRGSSKGPSSTAALPGQRSARASAAGARAPRPYIPSPVMQKQSAGRHSADAPSAAFASCPVDCKHVEDKALEQAWPL